jgi:hypothetical protein
MRCFTWSPFFDDCHLSPEIFRIYVILTLECWVLSANITALIYVLYIYMVNTQAFRALLNLLVFSVPQATTIVAESVASLVTYPPTHIANSRDCWNIWQIVMYVHLIWHKTNYKSFIIGVDKDLPLGLGNCILTHAASTKCSEQMEDNEKIEDLTVNKKDMPCICCSNVMGNLLNSLSIIFLIHLD